MNQLLLKRVWVLSLEFLEAYILISQGQHIEFDQEHIIGNLMIFFNTELWYLSGYCKAFNEKISPSYSNVLCFWIWFFICIVFWIL